MSKPQRQGPLAFWIHQVSEYALGILVASSAARLPHPELPIVVALVILLLAATADGSAAAVHLVKRPLHRRLDIGIGVAVVAVSAALFTRVGASAAILTGLAGVALLALSWQTDYAPKPVKVRRPPRQIRLPQRPSRPKVAGAQLSRGAKAEKVGRKAGRYAAVGVKVWKNRNK
jgi:hypothetical protein